ncbi:GNAT family N-acetyltransferase [Marmoricola endophyticus]|uniref:GNAT family N-acetyltransferase n=1 Tax=Marmoricola endophyticus TaxID=2040280 RepID=UPI001E4FDAEF|nr:GNAT family N-acetyltransferase [Marmoricola endophyticus]
MYDVRPAGPADLPLLAAIESAADALVTDLLACDPALFDATPGERRDADPGFLLVVDRPVVGFAQVLEEEGTAHLQQLCVHPEHGRLGRGTALVEACCAQAAVRGYDALTLTTFRDVSFNRPFYERLGFVVLDQPGGVLARHLRDEAAYDAVSPRVAMRRAW